MPEKPKRIYPLDVVKQVRKAWEDAPNHTTDPLGFQLTMEVSINILELKVRLQSHDWWYHMSDDNRCYLSGQFSIENIMTLRHKVGEDNFWKIYNEYAPEEKRKAL